MTTNESIEDRPNHDAGEEHLDSKEFIRQNDVIRQAAPNDSNDADLVGGHDHIRIKQELLEEENEEKDGKPALSSSNDVNDSTTAPAPATTTTTATATISDIEKIKNEHPIGQSGEENSLEVDDERQQHLQNNTNNNNHQQQQQNDTSTASNVESESSNGEQIKKEEPAEDDDLEEGELKDDDEDDDDDDDELQVPGRLSNFNNNNDTNNNDGFHKEPNFSDQRHAQGPHAQHFPSSQHHNKGGQGPPHLHQQHHHPNRRHHSPNNRQQQHHPPDMLGQFPLSHPFVNNNQGYPPNHDIGAGPPIPPHMEHQMHPMMGGLPDVMFNRGGPGGVGPMQKVSNVRCRFYSKTNNKCTWGDNCRFEHRDESPGPEFENRIPGPIPGPGPGPGPSLGRGPPIPQPMGAMDRLYSPYPSRHQPYPPHPPPMHGYSPYEQPYGPHHHHSTPPPLPPHSMPPHPWRQQHSPYPSPSSSAHPPESVSPAHLSSSGNQNSSGPVPPGSGSRGSSTQPPNTAGGSQPSSQPGSMPPLTGGPSSPNYPSSQSAVVYERKHRLAYEVAPWNDRGHPPPSSKYDRGYPPSSAGYPPPPPHGSRGGNPYYRNHYGREPYGRDLPMPPHHMSGGGGPHSYPAGYPPNYPSAYRGGPMGSHPSHYKYSSSSHRNMPPDVRRSRSNKRGHDEDESSWSDSGSEDSILGQASYSKSKMSKKQHNQQQPATATADNANSEDPLAQGSGTPPGEPLTEDRERQEMLLNKLKEIEDLMAKKKGEQEDPM